MRLRKWIGLARKAVHHPPAFVMRRAVQEVRRQAFRPWGRIRPLLFTDNALLDATRSSSIDELWDRLIRCPLPVATDQASVWAARFRAVSPDISRVILIEADHILRHEFDLLGSGMIALGNRLPWHEDFKVGRRWPLHYAADIDYNELDENSDVKVPWELSRCQHFARLGQAYWLTDDEQYAREFVDEVSDWVACNPWTRGINWACTMDVALRAISWAWGLRYFGRAAACRSREFRSLFLRSLFLHGEYIAAHVETADLNGNHYLVDGAGLVCLGLLFGGIGPASGWLETGRQMVFDEMQSQVWPDGVDFEQSIAYHRLVLETFLITYVWLTQAGNLVPQTAWKRLERMLEFVCAYTKPNGLAPLIGDADDGRIQKLGVQPVNDHRYLLSTGAVLFRRSDFKRAAGKFWDESFWLLGPQGRDDFDALPAADPIRSAAFPDGGFYVSRAPDTHLIMDCAEVGMRGRGGHGHNDILSFELFLNGMNVVTDCGAYLYTASREWRNLFRSTAFHNTVQVDHQEINRFVHADDMWRLHDDARPIDVTWRSNDRADFLRAAHDGYVRLASPVRHVRELLFDKIQRWFVFRDTIEGRDAHTLVWRFHLDPDVSVSLGTAGARIEGSTGQAWFHLAEGPRELKLRVESGWVSPSYGRKTEAAVLVLECERRLPVTVAYCFSCMPVPPDQLSRAIAQLEERE